MELETCRIRNPMDSKTGSSSAVMNKKWREEQFLERMQSNASSKSFFLTLLVSASGCTSNFRPVAGVKGIAETNFG